MALDRSILPITNQIAWLRECGMAVNDERHAEHCLRNISYSRLSAYWYPFWDTASGKQNIFVPGTRFEEAICLYLFDKKLRLIVMDAIEWIEVTIRARWISHMGSNYGTIGYMNRDLYRKDRDLDNAGFSYEGIREKLISEFNKSHDRAAILYRKSDSSSAEPPVWMATDAMTLGLLVNFIDGLKRPARSAIAKPFNIDENILISMIRNIAHVRNICAHHGRLWNRSLSVRSRLPRKPKALRLAMKMTTNKKRIHNTLVVMDYILSVTFPEFGREWRFNLIRHLEACPISNPKNMGFPAEWKEWTSWYDFQL